MKQCFSKQLQQSVRESEGYRRSKLRRNSREMKPQIHKYNCASLLHLLWKVSEPFPCWTSAAKGHCRSQARQHMEQTGDFTFLQIQCSSWHYSLGGSSEKTVPLRWAICGINLCQQQRNRRQQMEWFFKRVSKEIQVISEHWIWQLHGAISNCSKEQR